jgi:hypothetical protein
MDSGEYRCDGNIEFLAKASLGNEGLGTASGAMRGQFLAIIGGHPCTNTMFVAQTGCDPALRSR